MTDNNKGFTEQTRKPEKPKIVQNNGECSEILSESTDLILKMFEQEVRKKVPAAFNKNASAIIDHLPGFLEKVAKSLSRGAEVSAACADTDICKIHGAERAGLPNYTIEQVLFEYTILRRIILDVLREKTTVTAAESDVIFESFQEGMLQAASEFAKIHADQVERVNETLKARVAELKIIIESIPEAVYIGNESGVYEANKIALDQLGFNSVEEMNRNISELSTIVQNKDPETGLDVPPEELSFSKALKGEHSVKITDVIHLKTGEHRLIRGAAAPIIVNGKIQGAVAINTDITESRKAQAALSAKNKELDRFAAIAAHDLKSPLNSITQFTEFLAEQYEGKLDSDADQYINFIITAGNRMRDLIDNLLEFSRAGAIDKEKLLPIDINEVLSAVQTNLLVDIERTEAEINSSEKLPTVLGNKLQMIQLFQNLIANAIKFRKPHSSPVINIDFEEVGQCCRFRVADHGIGMDRSKSHKIFEIFHKAHTHEYEGSGIGLAVCKRIVEAHGGHIDFESAPGKGSVFIFTLPKEADIHC